MAKVLVVEDNPVNMIMMRRMLEYLGHAVEECRDGTQAVEMAVRGSFDVVLMDCQLPGMDGLSATRAIRHAGTTVPVIAVTAESTTDRPERFREAGMNAVLPKPVIMSELVEVLAKVQAKDRSAHSSTDEEEGHG